MASSRASGLWEDYNTMGRNSFDADETDLEEQGSSNAEDDFDGRTPLDRTIDRIGMGSYQWTLLSLCGFGWMADNMWLQAIAIILPRIQRHYAVPDNYIGAVSSSMFAGMMVGAVGWGTCSDLMGRITAFNATLFFTALFGLLASFTKSLPTLCMVLFFLGSSVGGSMPTDGTLLLEHMPKNKQYLVTALSIFFSFGAVLSAIVALLVLPNNSCSGDLHVPCDVDQDNQGWKYLLISLGLVTLVMFLARMVFFRLHESPRFLVHAGRPQEAIKSLQMISKFNGSNLSIELEDVRDHHHPSELPTTETETTSPRRLTPNRSTSTTIFDASVIEDRPPGPSRPSSSESGLATAYAATGETDHGLEAHMFGTPVIEHAHYPSITGSREDDDDSKGLRKSSHVGTPSVERHLMSSRDTPPTPRRLSTMSRRSSIYEEKVRKVLPRWLRRPLEAWWSRVMMVLSPEWLKITVVVWFVWCALSLAYTMFNVYLPKLLETRQQIDNKPQSLEESLWDVVIFTIGGCPGALLGAFLIESNLGRRWSLVGSTFVTAFFCTVFALVTSTWAVRATTVGISLSATAMWAVLYGWTPEIFATKVRGTACGIASALSRIGGMIAPILGGILLMMDRTFPVYTSVVIFVIAGLGILVLGDGDGESGRGNKSAGKTLLH
ncbi:major facilitator superfamily domain-containing protein [Crepidotus variabilis]|uniref:Major facilitator superfamily domain-containing protein n=1 Tax=Crepidotus variabilis TaxID=179855 RepID=A0A9P6JM75_9AGAR|nr:major facilitator superfamily domain-containing protein [Crepidotus variabilis]